MGNFFLETRLCDERKAREKIFISSSSILMYPISKLYTKLVKNYEELRTRVSLDDRSEIKSNSKDPFFRLPSINRLQCVFLCNVIRHSSPFYCSRNKLVITFSFRSIDRPLLAYSFFIRKLVSFPNGRINKSTNCYIPRNRWRRRYDDEKTALEQQVRAILFSFLLSSFFSLPSPLARDSVQDSSRLEESAGNGRQKNGRDREQRRRIVPFEGM